ncbi:MAG: FAD-binding oxidoreductase [Desulfosarcina sp.]|nr:FAD-binding oxidoreductase [Desulfosarcina sp.]MBC2743663.1 FAD-binding oxidoreductase [Desulfosarcina sp.]MBC2766572.1 FAD-binding oxidoreductase [Desulfosarcina sp.]
MHEKSLSHGLWADTAPPAPKLTPIEGEHSTDVAVIGGGYTGLSAALHLAKAGRDTILLEAEDIGYGGAGRNVGLVNAGLWLMPEELLRLAGPDYGEKLLAVLGDSPDLVYQLISEYEIECEALRNGTLHCADSKSGLKALRQREAQWQHRGAPVSLLDRDETAARTGSRCFLGALMDKRAGTIQPLSYAYGLARAALKHGARLFRNSPVTGHEKGRDGYRLITPQGTVKAKAVIIAVHAYPGFAFQSIKKSMIWMNFFQFATPPLDGEASESVLPGHQGSWDTNLILSSYRRDAAGRLIVGSIGTVNGFAYGLHEAWVKRTIAKTFPQVGEVPLEYGWYGTFAMNGNHIPRFHVLDENMVMVTSYNGRGIGPGTVFGKLLAEYIMGGSAENIPLPILKPETIKTRLFWELFYETGARMYHFIQRRF